MSKEKIYVDGMSVREKDGRFGPFLSVGVNWQKFLAWAEQHVNSRGYLNITLSKRRSPSKYGETHSASLDTYEPKRDSDDSIGF